MYFGSIHCFGLCGEIHVVIIETSEYRKDAFEGMCSENIEELNSLATTKSCIFQVYGSRKSHAIPVYSILTKCVYVPMKTKQMILLYLCLALMNIIRNSSHMYL